MPSSQPILGVVIVAAGNSTRMGSNKIYAEIAGHPMIYHTVRSFETHPLVSNICLVVESSKILEVEELVSKSNFHKVIKVCSGGETRQESVNLGLNHLTPSKLVGIHDGARPCIMHHTITNCIKLATSHGNAIPAIPVVDTIKQSKTDGTILRTIDRSKLWHAQTPQIFEWETIQNAYANNSGEHTDDSSLIESLNIGIRIADGDPRNIKVTTPIDLMLAEYILLNPEKE